MASSSHRISRRSDFSRTLKQGVRVSARDVAVHVLAVPSSLGEDRGIREDVAHEDVALFGGPWLGLIVSKAVGNAVVRHRVARRLRAAFADTMHHCPTDESFVVIRAHRAAADRSSVELAEQLAEAFGHRRVRAAARIGVGR